MTYLLYLQGIASQENKLKLNVYLGSSEARLALFSTKGQVK
jgi:hypothetical protein